MRTFTVDSVHRGTKKLMHTGGRFVSETPMGAAKKALSSVCKSKEKKCVYKIFVRETTMDSAKKVYGYYVTRLHDPTEVELRNGDVITFNYVVSARALK